MDRIEEEVFERCFRYLLRRAMRGVSEMELSDRTGISVVTLSQYRNGKTLPTLKNLRKLADALDCTPNDLTWVDEEEMLRLESLYH